MLHGLPLIFSVNIRLANRMKNNICGLLAFFLIACQPYLTYEELEEQAPNDPEVQKRLEKFEADVDRAMAYYEERALCSMDQKMMWACSGKEKYNKKRPPDNPDRLVRTYRWDRRICGCSKRMELVDQLERMRRW